MTFPIDQTPRFAQSVLFFGESAGTCAEAFGVARGCPAQAACRTDNLAPDALYDCIAAVGAPDGDELAALAPHVAPHGWLLMPWQESDDQEAFVQAVERAGLVVYDVQQRPPAAPIAIAVRPDYDPAAHARTFRERGRPDLSFEVLDAVPFRLRKEPELFVLIETEKQFCALEADAHEEGARRLERFWQGLNCLHEIVHLLPDASPAFQCQAEFWRRIGDPARGAALLRSLHAAEPPVAVATQLKALEREASAVVLSSPPLRANREHAVRRVLFILNAERPHYGLDTLFDGLCQLLGSENVVDFPSKPTLHGHREGFTTNQWERYPCLFDWPDAEQPLEALLDDLRRGGFDAVLFGDLEHDLPQETARRIMDAAGATPLYVVDQQDDPLNNAPRVEEFLGRAAAGYFKREFLRSANYGPNAWPLPFSWPDARLAPPPETPREQDLFWAGHRRFGLRRLYLEALERALDRTLDTVLEPCAYAAALDRSRLGLCLGGVGFDTIRYWELPAHGCALFAERPPIVIPDDFVDGDSAIFFADLPELKEKLRHYLARPGEAEAIGSRGREHLAAFHLSSHRAAQLLTRMGAALERGAPKKKGRQ